MGRGVSQRTLGIPIPQVLIVVEPIVVVIVVVNVDVVHSNVVVIVAIVHGWPVAVGRSKRRSVHGPIHIGRRVERASTVIHAAVAPGGIVVIVAYRGTNRDAGHKTKYPDGGCCARVDSLIFFLFGCCGGCGR